MGSLPDDLRAQGLTLIETHISWVFLGADDVYKVKKPVKLGFLDFSHVEDRKRLCETEVRLNRRFSTNVYRGVLPVTVERDGRHRIAGKGDVVDWAVHMERLPAADAADARLAAGTLRRDDVLAIADAVAAFHGRISAAPEVAEYGSVEAIRRNVEDNFAETADVLGDYLSEREARAIVDYQRGFLDRHGDRLEARVAAGRIKDGHGDLRLEHVYMRPAGIEIIDCIEFNDRFRYADVCADVAFLSMDLLEHERQGLSETLLARYAMVADDYDLYGVVDFYESYRAYVRGKVASIVASDENATPDARARAAAQARRYLLLAEACAQPPLAPPVVVAVGGLIASGKSSLAARLSERLSAPAVEADRTRKSLAGVAATTKLGGEAFSDAYSEERTQAVYDELLRRAEVVVSSGRSVVIDASFRSQRHRLAVADMAKRHGLPCLFVECWVPREEAMARLAKREQGPATSDGRREIYDAFAADYEPVTPFEGAQVVRVDTRAEEPYELWQALSGLTHVPTATAPEQDPGTDTP